MLELLTTAFRQLLSMALTALPVMAAVLLVRALLGKAPRKYAYALWLVVALRLVCPVTFPESALSLFNLNALAPVTEHTVEVGGGLTAVAPLPAPPPAGTASQPMPDLAGPPETGWTFDENPALVTTPEQLVLEAAALIWVTGLAALAWWGVKSYLRLRRQVAAAVRREEGVWECDAIPTPFVLGLFRPNIYIPFRLSDGERTYVLAHERHHIRRRDHWTKPLALVILAVYWWDPAVWLCWVLYCRDMEMSCDEAVLAKLGQEVKADYSRSLVSFALDRRMPTALAFGEHDASRRVKNVLDWKRARPAITFLGIAAVALTLVVCGTGAQDDGTWLRREKPDILGVPCYSYSVSEEAGSFVFYREVYEYGVLTDRASLVFGDFEDGGGTAPKKGEFAIRMDQAWDTNTVLEWGLGQMKTGERADIPNGHVYMDRSKIMGGTWTFAPTYETQWTLPERFGGGGMEFSSLLKGGTGRKMSLKPTSDTVLAAYYPHEDANMILSAPICDILNDGDPAALLADTPYAIVIRLRLGPYASNLCQESVEWGSSDLAAKLYALRAEEVTEAAVAEVLALLGDTTPFTLEKGYFLAPDALLVHFETEPAFGEAACNMTALLPALFGDVEKVEWSCPNQNGGNVYHEMYSPDSEYMNLTDLARELGYADIKDLGQHRDGIRALVDSLCIPQGSIMANTPKEPPQPPTAEELARRLFNWRTDHTTDTVKIEMILNALAVPAPREVSTSWSGGRPVLHVWFPEETTDRSVIEKTMWSASQVLLALVGDAYRVDYGWPTADGSHLISKPLEGATNDFAFREGYDGVKGLGRTSKGVLALLNFLGVGYEENFTPSEPIDLATRLHTLRTGSVENEANVRAILNAMGANALGEYALSHPNQGILRIKFSEAPPEQELEALMRPASCLLTALVEDLEHVDWDCPTADGRGTTRIGRSVSDFYAQALGYDDIKDLGLTTEGIQRFLDVWGDTDQGELSADAELFFITAQESSQSMVLSEYLLRSGPWPLPEDVVYSFVEAGDVLEFIFEEPIDDPDAVDTALARCAMILLDLRPWVDTVRWYWPDGETRTFDREHDMAMILAASSDSAIAAERPSETPEALDRLMTYVGGIDGKLCRSLARDEG